MTGQATPRADVARIYAEVLAEILGADSVATDKHFFEDLGADSLMMARFCARIRKRDDVPTVSMKDVYTGLTIAGLVSLVAPAQSAPEARPTGSRADIERIYAEVLAEILGADSVATDKHFFDELRSEEHT